MCNQTFCLGIITCICRLYLSPAFEMKHLESSKIIKLREKMVCQIFSLRILLDIAKKRKSVHLEEASWTFTKPSYSCTLRSVPLTWLLQFKWVISSVWRKFTLCPCRYMTSLHTKNSDFTLFSTLSTAIRMRMRTSAQLSPVFYLPMFSPIVAFEVSRTNNKNLSVCVCVFSQCALLNEKLDSLVKALSEEAEAQVIMLPLTE